MFAIFKLKSAKIDLILPLTSSWTLQRRGATTQVVSVYDEYSSADVFNDPSTKQKLLALEKQYLAARENAVAIVRVNASLAIRDAFDRLQDGRLG
jgi:hypothetical protein